MGSRDISIVIPTVKGREDWLRKSIRTYTRETPDAEIIVITDYPSCGEAWIEGAAKSTREYVHFTADDIVPAENWWVDATRMLSRGIVPVCNVYSWQNRPEWSEAPMGEMGSYHNVMVPFLSRTMLNLKNWMLPIHYGSDMWATYMAARYYKVEECPTYKVWHWLAPEGRVPQREFRDKACLIRAMEDEGYLPPYFAWMKEKYGEVSSV